MNPRKDYYAILGVLATAEDVVIQGAYRGLAQRYHPDRFEGNRDEANARMAEINEAHDVLADEGRRAEYDQARDRTLRSGGAAPAGGAMAMDSRMAFELQQFLPFAEKLREFGYDAAAIREVLAGRGVRPAVAEHLAMMVTGGS